MNLGFLDATGLDLGAVTISGDLGRVAAGDTDLHTPGLQSLTAGSMGFFGLGTQAAGGNLHSEVAGSIGSLTLRGDFSHAALHATGKAGPINIGGDLLGGTEAFSGSLRIDGALASFTLGGSLIAGSGTDSGLVQSGGAFGRALIKGSVAEGASLISGGKLGAVAIRGELAGADETHRAGVIAAGSLGSLTVGGSVSFAQVLAGYSKDRQPINPDVTIGAVKVTNNWIASDLVAGIAPGADGLLGTNDDAAATPAAPLKDQLQLISKIASIRIAGYVAGTAGNAADHFAFTAQQISKVSLGAQTFTLDPKVLDVLSLGLTGDVTLAEIAS